MPSIFAPDGINIEQHNERIKGYLCLGCGSKKLKSISFVIGENSSAFCHKCIECNKDDYFVYTKKKLSSPDVIIIAVDTIGDLDKQNQKETSNWNCSKCNKGKLRSIDNSRSQQMALDIVECNNCGFSVPIISIVRDITKGFR